MNNIRFTMNQEDYSRIPSFPISYWVSKNLVNLYKNPLIGSRYTAKEGVGTRNDDVFLKYYWEVSMTNIGRDKRWVFTDKAGEYRKWYLSLTYVMDWENDGYRIKHYYTDDGKLRSRPQNLQYLFKQGISWGKIGTGASSFRLREVGYAFNDAAPTLFGSNEYALLGALNSKIYRLLLEIRGSTLNMTCGIIEELPLLGYTGDERQKKIEEVVLKNIQLSKVESMEYELSKDFKKHPLI